MKFSFLTIKRISVALGLVFLLIMVVIVIVLKNTEEIETNITVPVIKTAKEYTDTTQEDVVTREEQIARANFLKEHQKNIEEKTVPDVSPLQFAQNMQSDRIQ